MRHRAILFVMVAGVALCAAAADKPGNVAGIAKGVASLTAETEYAKRHVSSCMGLVRLLTQWLAPHFSCRC